MANTGEKAIGSSSGTLIPLSADVHSLPAVLAAIKSIKNFTTS
ncbi:hypothetical protein ACQV2W_00505 [Facklamia sp. P12934]